MVKVVYNQGTHAIEALGMLQHSSDNTSSHLSTLTHTIHLRDGRQAVVFVALLVSKSSQQIYYNVCLQMQHAMYNPLQTVV